MGDGQVVKIDLAVSPAEAASALRLLAAAALRRGRRPLVVDLSTGARAQDRSADVRELRTVRSLAENWKFTLDDSMSDEAALRASGAQWKTVALPHTWNARDAAGMNVTAPYHRGLGWYRLEFDTPASGARHLARRGLVEGEERLRARAQLRTDIGRRRRAQAGVHHVGHHSSDRPDRSRHGQAAREDEHYLRWSRVEERERAGERGMSGRWHAAPAQPRQRRHALGGSGACTRRPLPRRRSRSVIGYDQPN